MLKYTEVDVIMSLDNFQHFLSFFVFIGGVAVPETNRGKSVLHFVDNNGRIRIDERAGIYVPGEGERVVVKTRKTVPGPAAKNIDSIKRSNRFHDFSYLREQEKDVVIQGKVQKVYDRFINIVYSDSYEHIISTTVMMVDLLTKKTEIEPLREVAK